MNIILRFQAVIASFSEALAREFVNIATRCNVWGGKEHNPETGAHTHISVTGLTFDGDTQTTVGAAGGASALPATPTGYITITIGATEYVVPYYAQS